MSDSKYVWNKGGELPPGAESALEASGQTSRRRFVTLAVGVPAAAAMPFLFASEANAAQNPNLARDLSAIQAVHPNRRDYFTIHHSGGQCAHSYTQSCKIYACNCEYDFVIQYDGRLTVCGSHSAATGSHAKRCNCRALGVLLAGCFGCAPKSPCSSNPRQPSAAQECTLAALMATVRQESGRPSLYNVSNLRTHRNCYYWNPCGGSGTQTDCPGPSMVSDNTTNHNWSQLGLNFRASVVAKYGHQERCGNCTGRPCDN